MFSFFVFNVERLGFCLDCFNNPQIRNLRIAANVSFDISFFKPASHIPQMQDAGEFLYVLILINSNPASCNVRNSGYGVPIIFIWFVSACTPHPVKCGIASCGAN